jgi:dTDP-4-amino-4,6-dideoxygalactose transaminase
MPEWATHGRRGSLTKLPTSWSNRRTFGYYANARTAFRAFLKEHESETPRPILLPAYIGWSSREGSGVFDPLNDAGRHVVFYRVNARLELDVEHFRRLLNDQAPSGVVIIHYFGYVDPAYPAAARMARESGAWVVEDEAHALLTDLVGGATGRLGDAALFSLHKILPVSGGGVLVRNRPDEAPRGDAVANPVPPSQLWDFDLHRIALARRRNARQWKRALRHLSAWLKPLRDEPKHGEVPQSFPMTVHGVSRDELYTHLNGAGVGVVSLYHTLIAKISSEDYPNSHMLAKAIINFPVHQDVTVDDIQAAVPVVEQAIQRLAHAK